VFLIYAYIYIYIYDFVKETVRQASHMLQSLPPPLPLCGWSWCPTAGITVEPKRDCGMAPWKLRHMQYLAKSHQTNIGYVAQPVYILRLDFCYNAHRQTQLSLGNMRCDIEHSLIVSKTPTTKRIYSRLRACASNRYSDCVLSEARRTNCF
jgi:hypothetical protein